MHVHCPNCGGANEAVLMSGADAFRLCDTHGLPFDMLQELLRERGQGFDWYGFCEAAAKAGWSADRCRELLEAEGKAYEKEPELFWGIVKAFDAQNI